MQNIHRIKTEEQAAKENLQTLNLKRNNGNEEVTTLTKRTDSLKQQFDENVRMIAIKEKKLEELISGKDALNESHKEFSINVRNCRSRSMDWTNRHSRSMHRLRSCLNRRKV